MRRNRPALKWYEKDCITPTIKFIKQNFMAIVVTVLEAAFLVAGLVLIIALVTTFG